MLKDEYSFYLTDAQRWAIRDVSLDSVNVYFGADGSVIGILFEEYEVITFTFRRDGEIVREARGLGSDGWTTNTCDVKGVWDYDKEVV